MFDHLNTNKRLVCIAVAMSLLSACGGGESGSTKPTPDVGTDKVTEISYPIHGVAVKGPLKFADVKIYQFDKLSPNGLGKLLGTAETDSTAKIKSLSLKGELQDFFIIEYTANELTVDITTGQAPVFNVLRGIFSAEQIKANQPLYATPLSTLTVKLALHKTVSGLSTSQAIDAAEKEVKSLFAFGMDSNVSLLTTPPLLTDATVENVQQRNTWYVRTINEINAALVHQLHLTIADEQLSVDHLLDELVSDVKDGKLDAQSNTDTLSYDEDSISVLLTPVHALNIPSTEILLVSELSRVMVEETTTTGYSTVDTSAMSSSELVLNNAHILMNIDIDGDGINNVDDLDNDNDGIIDTDDTDDDNDGYGDTLDAFPFDPTEWLDTDSDGLGNNADSDDDNDGVNDEDDVFPLNGSEWLDTDNDGIGNNSDTDDDNDGYDDATDSFPLNPSEWFDTDLDGIGNNADTDDDNDGHEDTNDAFPLNAQEWLDTDGDGIGNNADADDDNDNVPDSTDAFPTDPNEQLDTDNDGVGNNADPDDDNDGFHDDQDAFPLNSQEWIDTDLDGIGNNADTDDDNDGVVDSQDAFPLNPSESHDADGDGVGNNQDPDDDNDGQPDTEDHIQLNGAESSYATGEFINLRIKGFGKYFEVLSASNGWHVTYYTYDKASPENHIQRYINEGYYNGVYDSDTKEWVVSFPAVEYSGNFETQVTLYCSRPDSICGGQYNSNGWQQNISYTVECTSGDNCEYLPEPEPESAVNISDSEESSQASSLFTRRNGDVLALYVSGIANRHAVVSTSTDDGQTWPLSSSPTSPYSENTSSESWLFV